MERITERKTSCWIKTKSGKDYTNYTKDWDAISELAAYEDTDLTPPEIMELKERNTPKEAIYEGDGYSDEEMVYDTWICPNCGAKYEVDYDDYDFCPDCGQMILR